MFLHTVVLAREVRSDHFREQRRLLRKFFPEQMFFPHVTHVRNWGEGASLALTRRFFVARDLVNWGVHPEIDAVRGGTESADEYARHLVEDKGWDPQAAAERIAKSAHLLVQNPKDLFCEVSIHPSGVLMIHDGFHRAAIMAASDLPGISVKVSVNLFLT